ncbi:MAG TPA: hypothetical protein VKW06_18185 [Candidatus Angelobacter sp.]|nr:hypothetical protein [Candidatus Angelobacter sp.]
MIRRSSLALASIVIFFPTLLLAQSRNGQATAQLTVTINVVPSVGIVVPARGTPYIESANTADPVKTFGGLFRSSDKSSPVAYQFPARREQTIATEETRTLITNSGKSAVLKTTIVVPR